MEALKSRLKTHVVPSLTGSQLNLRQRLSEGIYGTVYIADAHGLPDYGRSVADNANDEDGENNKKLVAVKFMPDSASEEEK